MESITKSIQAPQTKPEEAPRPQQPERLGAWFSVAGDVDDFIFYGEDPTAVSGR